MSDERRRVRRSRNPLAEEALPASASETDLKWRVQVLPARAEHQLTLRLLLVQATWFSVPFLLLGFLAGPLFHGLNGFLAFAVIVGLIAFGWVCIGHMLPGEVLSWLACGLVVWLALQVTVDADPVFIYLAVFGPAVLLALAHQHMVATQAAMGMAANIRHPWKVMVRWEKLWWRFVATGHSTRRCPEVGIYRSGNLLAVVAYLAGLAVTDLVEIFRGPALALIAGIGGFTLGLWILWSLAAEFSKSVVDGFRITASVWWSFVFWIVYNPMDMKAAGIFLFPTRLFRYIRRRRLFTWTTLAGLGLSILCAASHALPRSPEKMPLPWEITIVEQLFAGQEPGQASAFQLSEGSIGPEVAALVGLTLLSALAPAFILFSIHQTTGGRLLAAYYSALEADDATELKPDLNVWENIDDRITHSRNPLEKQHIFAGFNPEFSLPVYIHLQILSEGANLSGGPGCGKTARLSEVVTQLIRRGESVLIVDAKPDNSLFATAYLEAKRADIPFQVFSTSVGKTANAFSYFRQSHIQGRITFLQLTNGLLEALALSYGEVYGENWFGDLSNMILYAYLRARREIQTFRDLARLLDDEGVYRAVARKFKPEAALHLSIKVGQLASLEHLNVTPETAPSPDVIEHQIDMAPLFKSQRVVYFHLKSFLDSSIAAVLGRLGLFAVAQAADALEPAEKPRRVWVVIDEFQNFVVENLKQLMEMGRGKGLSFITANQGMFQLKTNKLDLTGTVRGCFAVEWPLRISDKETLEWLKLVGGELRYTNAQWDETLPFGSDPDGDGAFSLDHLSSLFHPGVVRASEAYGAALETGELVELSARRDRSIIRFSAMSGFTAFPYPVPIQSMFHIPKDEHTYRENMSWPDITGAFPVTTDSETHEPPRRGPIIS